MIIDDKKAVQMAAEMREAAVALARQRKEIAGWKQELRDLADAIPTDNSWGDSELMRAVAQAHLVLQEGLQ